VRARRLPCAWPRPSVGRPGRSNGAAGIAGITALGALPLAAQTAARTKQNRKMVVRAEDIGMSKFCNIGSVEAIENGVVTAADVMLDSPGTEDALERLKKFPHRQRGFEDED